GSDHVLHVLDGLAVELIVKRGEVVHGTLPLIVDVLVASTAELRVHEEIGGNDGFGIGLRRRWGKGRVRSAALVVHGDWDDAGVLDTVAGIGPRFSVKGASRGQEDEYGDGGHEGRSPGTGRGVKDAEADDDHGNDG